jgi:tetraacyldisaccharide 4'-kinase
MIKFFLKLLYPFGLIYGLFTWIRNKLFDIGFFKQTQFDVPVISIGNLSMGGTGKTPHIEHFIKLFQTSHTIAILSRGYGRKTEGFKYVVEHDTPHASGDEPLQIKRKFPQIIVAVDEKRVHGIETILSDHPLVNLILLDDSFQHRYVKPTLNILLTEYENPFWNDLVVPAGGLREFKWGWERADVLIITKCPENNSLTVPAKYQRIPCFFSRIVYLNPIVISGEISKKIVLLTGIANPAPLFKHLQSKAYEIVKHFNFPDHHNFNENELNSVSKTALNNEATIVTTEKDWMRLKSFWADKNLNIAILPIGVKIENEPHNWLALEANI